MLGIKSRIMIARLLLSAAVAASIINFSPASIASENNSLGRAIATTTDGDSSELADLVQQVHQKINQYRQSLDLDPLSLNDQISQQAEAHSQDMAQQKVKFGHRGFASRIKALANDISYRSAAENVAYNQGYGDPAEQAVTGWLKSKGHRKNIVGNYNLTGIGVAKNQQGEYYFTQIFIKGSLD